MKTTRLTSLRFCPLFFCLGALLSVFTAAHAETTSASGATAITSVPCTIDQPGIYYLTADFTVTNQTAISITAANVTLDLNGHTLTDTRNDSGSIGIYVPGAYATVLHGRVSGPTYGMYITGDGCRVQEVTVDGESFFGFGTSGANTLIQHCRVNNIGGAFVGGASIYNQADCNGIILLGTNDRVVDCDIVNLKPRPSWIGVGVLCYNGCLGCMIVGNRLSGCQAGISTDSATTKYRDNLCTADVTTPYAGGTDAGNNQ